MPPDHKAHIVWDDLDDLVRRFHPKNPKGHDLAAIEASFTRVGFVALPIINDLDGKLVVGHGRAEALLARRQRGAPPPEGVRVGPGGEWLVPTVHGVSLKPDDAEAYLLADNRTTELGGWDDRRLAEVLAELRSTDAGLDGVGFSIEDLTVLLDELGRPNLASDGDPDEIPESPAERDLYVQAGELWTLGGNRVLCGDATVARDVQRLTAGQPATMSFCDPPYGVAYRPRGRRGRRRGSPPIGDVDPRQSPTMRSTQWRFVGS